MAECECLPKCPFFHDKMESMPSVAGMMKKKYCQGDNSTCARFMVFEAKGRDFVPADLYPSQQERAKQIISAF
jgi:hypothetical protein